MCGILGGFWPQKEQLVIGRLSDALEGMAHRGPDDEGLETFGFGQGEVVFGHRRLSIIDLSDGGHQPISSVDGRYTLLYNGEIYNYKELRVDLEQAGHQFQTESDTEVLLVAWQVWGRTCLTRLEGMFAFALLDHQAQKMTLVRDPFGIKPLYYTNEGGAFLFASELPALLSMRETKPVPNLQTAYNYLVHFAYDNGPQSFVQDVYHLMPAHLLDIDLDTGNIGDPEMWWELPTQLDGNWTLDSATEAVREAFLHNVRLHLRSDVPVGVALSGGIDSSAVACAIRYLEPDMPIHSFSFIAKDDPASEEYWIDRVNDHIGAIPHKTVATGTELLTDLDTMIKAQGEPFGSTSIYGGFRVFSSAAKHGIKVTLDGQGADELLAGYQGYPGARMASLWEKRQWFSMIKFSLAQRNWPKRTVRRAWTEMGRYVLPGWIYNPLRQRMHNFEPNWLNVSKFKEQNVEMFEHRRALIPKFRGRRVIEQLFFALQHSGLQHLLRHGDRNSMAFSIESRVPFLTPSFAKLMLSMPEEFLVSPEGETKSIFRRAMRGIVPDEVLDRRDKIGFQTPEKTWLGQEKQKFEECLRDADDIPFLNSEPMVQHFNAVLAGKQRFDWQIWMWINYIRWYQLTIRDEVNR